MGRSTARRCTSSAASARTEPRRLQAFLSVTVPDVWNGQPVDFLSTLNDTGADVLGAPTSAPAADPHNPQFIYQRFQNGVLFYNAAEGSTSVLPFS